MCGFKTILFLAVRSKREGDLLGFDGWRIKFTTVLSNTDSWKVRVLFTIRRDFVRNNHQMARSFQVTKVQRQLSILKRKMLFSRKAKLFPRLVRSRPRTVSQVLTGSHSVAGIQSPRHFESGAVDSFEVEDSEIEFVPQTYWDELYESAFSLIQSSPWDKNDD